MQERIGVDEAVTALLRAVAPVETVETVDRDAAVGRVLASPPTATDDVPPSPRAARPGRAVAADATAGATRDSPAVFGDAPAVATGDPLPAGADAVAPSSAVARHGDLVELATPLVPGEGVVEAGTLAAAGDPVLHDGTVVRRSDAAVLARAGVERCEVYDRPRVAVRGEDGPVRAAVVATLQRAGCEPVAGGDGAVPSVVVGGRAGEERPGAPTIFDGVAVSPGGETAAWQGPPPTVSLSPEPATVLVVEALLGQVARRLARRPTRPGRGDVRLTAKTPSTVGETTFVGVRLEEPSSPISTVDGVDAEHVGGASGAVPAATPVEPLTSHDAVIRIPERVEGYPEDTIVTAEYLEA